MAFHMACPITCKRICYCTLGFPTNTRSDNSSDHTLQLHRLISDPSSLAFFTPILQVPVPKLSPPLSAHDGAGSNADEDDEDLLPLAALASLAAGDLSDFDLKCSPRDVDGEEQAQQGSSTVSIMCRLCDSVEIRGTGREKRMYSCRICRKRYHRSCLKTWALYRDLFDWSSWACPSCRACEVCSSTRDPNKFQFCRRCDAAYHCYCIQPPHKNVNPGPYLCPNHTRCHSCNSNVPGNGLSLRWFLGYTCCDACGRLFTKGNYCPVCLRVYRDSESTPMVCCDICQRWVHCECDNISDEKYMQFQADGNLLYTCSACRGECYQVKDLEDAMQELWKRRDAADRDIIATLRASAGLPNQEEIFAIPDGEDCGPHGVKKEYGRGRLSLKGLENISPKMMKDLGKKSSIKKKKGHQMTIHGKIGSNPIFKGYLDVGSMGYAQNPVKDAVQAHMRRPVSRPAEVIFPINEQVDLKQKNVDESHETVNNEKRYGILQTKSKTIKNTAFSEDVSMGASKKGIKATKLLIHVGERNRNTPNSPKSDTSSYQREDELAVLNGEGEISFADGSDVAASHDKGGKFGVRDVKFRETEITAVRLEKGKSNTGKSSGIDQGKETSVNRVLSSEKAPILLTKRGAGSTAETGDIAYSRKHPETPILLLKMRGGSKKEAGDIIYSRKHPNRHSVLGATCNTDSQAPSSFYATSNDSKSTLKLKIKPPFQDFRTSHDKEEKGVAVKRQRSKRKRPLQKPNSEGVDDYTESLQGSLMNDIMDACWILKKLGKDAIGKRVEVQQPSDNSWHEGVVSNLDKGTSMLSVNFDDGRTKTVELGNQRVRFVAQKKRLQL